jgi:hypothetical protein
MSTSDVLSNESNSETSVCYICMSSEDILIKPCQCKYVHQTCLDQWIETNHKNTCEICDQPYFKTTNTEQQIHITYHYSECSQCTHECILWFLLILTPLIALLLFHGFTYYDANVLRHQIIRYDQDFVNYKTTICNSLNTSANCFEYGYLQNKCYHDSKKKDFCHEPHTKYCKEHCSNYVDHMQTQIDQQYKTFIGSQEYDTRHDDRSMFIWVILVLVMSHIFILSLLIVAWWSGPWSEYNRDIQHTENIKHLTWYTCQVFVVII